LTGVERLTKRLRLVPIGRQHAGEVWRLHWDESVAAWYWGRYTAQQAERAAADMGRAWQTRGVHKWLAYHRETGELVGRGGLSYKTLEGIEWLEVGWLLRGAYWGNGYATEIGRAGLDFAFDELGAAEVVAFTEPHNARSRAVMVRLGMSYQREITHDGDRYALYTITAPSPG
jgi:[ribosomal protein S5]-alanine N-acetyltransferase